MKPLDPNRRGHHSHLTNHQGLPLNQHPHPPSLHHQHHLQQQLQASISSQNQRSRGKRTPSVRANLPVRVEMLNVEPEHGNRVAPREMVAEETSSSSHLSPGTEHPVHAKDHHVANFLAKRTTWSESHPEPEVVPTAGAAVAYQQQVNLMKQEATEADGNDEDHASKNKQFNQSQPSGSREEHLLNELNSLGATALPKSPNHCLATAMYNLKALTGEHPFSCDVCGRSFVQNHSLTRHMRTHTGERPYPCSTCGKAFIQNHSLTRHMRTHTGERPFSCTTCGRGFAEHHKLKSHVKSHRLARHVRLHTTEAQGNLNHNHQQGPPNVQPPQQPTSTNSQQPPQERVLPPPPHPHPQQQQEGHHSPPPHQPVVQLLHHPLVLPIPLPVRSHFMKDMT
ncbi:hypothetical protein FOCC_FOCC012370 [Frankliniella occidentalis]|nr:hypothetical protein FOCC_FOCC012370 [Frankliniella occidentalis]